MSEVCKSNPDEVSGMSKGFHCWHDHEDTRSRHDVCCWCGKQEDTAQKTPPHGPYAMCAQAGRPTAGGG